MTSSDLRLSHLEPTRDGGWLINFSCPDRARFHLALDEMKRLISRHDREYDPRQRCWWLASDADLLRLDRLFPDLRQQMREAKAGVWEAAQRPAPPPTLRLDAATAAALDMLYLTPGAPRTVAQAAYRALAREHHPDHGGTTERMRDLNAAYEQVCAWYDRQVAPQEPHTNSRRRGGKGAA
jgi:hypothetical protein